MTKNNKKPGQISMTLGLLLVAAALLIAVYNVYDSYRAQKASEAVLEQMAERVPSEDLKIYRRFPWIDMPETEIDGNMYIGYAELPDRGISLPILSDWSYRGLRIAPCRYKGSVYMGDMIICGHNYRSHFGQFAEVTAGERVRFTDMWGNVFNYTVKAVETIPTKDVEAMEAGDWDLTLFTCNRSGRQRITLRCVEDLSAD